MRSKILRCVACKAYTMSEVCPKCGADTKITIPLRFSPEDRYGRYRRAALQSSISDLSSHNSVDEIDERDLCSKDS
jgi:H/ACA ribonucleoprotein complex subunit 3